MKLIDTLRGHKLEPISELRPGTLIQNRYTIVQRMGVGGFGTVYEAKDKRLNRRVALKQLLRPGESVTRQFRLEAQLLANLRHDYLPNVIDYFTDAAGQFLVMEFIPGDDLSERLSDRNAPFDVVEVLQWGLQLLDVLQYLHTHTPGHPIIHRDIKPQNLKLRSDGKIILLDFGLAKGYVGAENAPPSIPQHSFMAYTEVYAAPEQVEGTGTDERTDLYELGATLYCLLTNVPPVEAKKRFWAVARNNPDPMRALHKYNSQVPEAVSRVVMAAVALEPDERPQSAREMREMLQQAFDASRTSVPTPTDSPPNNPGPQPGVDEARVNQAIVDDREAEKIEEASADQTEIREPWIGVDNTEIREPWIGVEQTEIEQPGVESPKEEEKVAGRPVDVPEPLPKRRLSVPLAKKSARWALDHTMLAAIGTIVLLIVGVGVGSLIFGASNPHGPQPTPTPIATATNFMAEATETAQAQAISTPGCVQITPLRSGSASVEASCAKVTLTSASGFDSEEPVTITLTYSPTNVTLVGGEDGAPTPVLIAHDTATGKEGKIQHQVEYTIKPSDPSGTWTFLAVGQSLWSATVSFVVER